MKHATEKTLANVSALLDDLRSFPEIKEKKPGVFYRKSRAFLHFHEEDDKLFADVRLQGSDFDRFPATTRADQKKLLTNIKKALSRPGG